MTWEQFEDFLQQLVADLTGKTTVWAHQNAPRPKKPYIALRLYSLRGVGGLDEILLTETPGELLVKGDREITLEAQWFGPGSTNGLERLWQALQRPTITERCEAAKIAIFDAQDVQNISGLLDGKAWEERASLDLYVRFARTTIDVPGYIEMVIVETSVGDKLVDKQITIGGSS